MRHARTCTAGVISYHQVPLSYRSGSAQPEMETAIPDSDVDADNLTRPTKSLTQQRAPVANFAVITPPDTSTESTIDPPPPTGPATVGESPAARDTPTRTSAASMSPFLEEAVHAHAPAGYHHERSQSA